MEWLVLMPFTYRSGGTERPPGPNYDFHVGSIRQSGESRVYRAPPPKFSRPNKRFEPYSRQFLRERLKPLNVVIVVAHFPYPNPPASFRRHAISNPPDETNGPTVLALELWPALFPSPLESLPPEPRPPLELFPKLSPNNCCQVFTLSSTDPSAKACFAVRAGQSRFN